MADPQYPDVPDEDGVPPVRRDHSIPSGIPLAKAKASIAQASLAGKWGIYTQGGALVIEPDSIVGFEVTRGFRIADYPLEKGGFESYDKVAMPFETRVTMTKGGALADRTSFLKTLDSIVGKLDLYNVVTPEKTYLNVNIMQDSQSRTSERGTTLLTVEVQLREIRETATASFTKSESPVPPPTPAQDKRPPTTDAGTTRKPASTRRRNNGAAQPKQTKSMSPAEERRIQQSWATAPHPRLVIFGPSPLPPDDSEAPINGRVIHG